MNERIRRVVMHSVAGFTFLLGASFVWAHAFPKRQSPPAGAELAASPAEVRIDFDDALEPAFSSLSITDSVGHSISTTKSRVDPANPKVMTLGLPTLSPGIYRVRWIAVAHDGHRTQGDYTFRVK